MHETVEQRYQSNQTSECNPELRIATDTATWLAETLHGSMRTSFEFTFDGQEFRGEDGYSVDEVFEEGIAEAKAMAAWNPSLLFELRRRLIEAEELEAMHKMVSDELPNTMIVLSDFPPELMHANEDVGGYNVSRQQTMMRIIMLRNDKLHITNQSLDGSDRKALEAIGTAMGVGFEAGELLSQRIHRALPEDWQDNLANNLTKVYDDSLAEQRGGEWHAGISQQPDQNISNTYDFVLAQNDLIEWFTNEKLTDSVGAERLRYELAATAKARHNRYLKSQSNAPAIPGTVTLESFATVPNVVNAHIAQQGLLYELKREARSAAAKGEVFSGCGGTVKADNELDGLSTADSLSQIGYGNKVKTPGASDKFGSLKFKCPKGHENTRPRNKLIDCCTTCGVSVKC
jgi:hypothetical protein